MYTLSINLARYGTHYCGRHNSFKPYYGRDLSILGNPFYMPNEEYRDSVCDKYENYFNSQIKINNKMKSAVDEILESLKHRDVILGCFCYPKRCHCETIVKHVNSLLSDTN